MAMLTKLIILAVFLSLLNFASDGFVFQQIDKIDLSQYGDSAKCAAGAYMATPYWEGLPIIPGSDDILFAAIGGLFILGIFSAFNKQLRTRYKIFVFVLVWAVYKLVGHWMVVSTPGCLDYIETYNAAIAPLVPLFFIIALFLLFKVYVARRK